MKLQSKLDYFGLWLVTAAVITILAGVIYLTTQQGLRQGANDPQIQIAEDAAFELMDGKDPSGFESNNKVHIERSLAPYLIIYDSQGRVMASNGELYGKAPIIPLEALEVSLSRGQNRFTWQPTPMVRSAVVVVSFGNEQQYGFAVSGRSLREIEVREENVLLVVGFSWLLSLGITLAATIGLFFLTKFTSRSE